MFVVAGLTKDAHQARGLIRALKDEGFEAQDIDMSGGPIAALTGLGVPEGEAHVFAEGIRRGGALVAVRADDEIRAEQAALVMNRHGVVDIGECAAGWRRQGWSGRICAPEDRVVIERYAYVFGEYPAGAGRIYRHPRTRGRYQGPERRRMASPYTGFDRRAA